MRLYRYDKYECITTISCFKTDTEKYSIKLGDFKCVKYSISLKLEKLYTFGRFINNKVKKWEYINHKNNEYYL